MDLTYLDQTSSEHFNNRGWGDVARDLERLGMVIPEMDVAALGWPGWPAPEDYGIGSDPIWAEYDSWFKDQWDLILPERVDPQAPDWVREYHRAKYAAGSWAMPNPRGIHEYKLSSMDSGYVITPQEIRAATLQLDAQRAAGTAVEAWFLNFADWLSLAVDHHGVVVS